MKTLSLERKKKLTVNILSTIVASILLAFTGYGLYLSGHLTANASFIGLIIVQIVFTLLNCIWFGEAINDVEFNNTCRGVWWRVLLFFVPAIYLLSETGATSFIYVTAFMPLFMTVIHCAEWCVKNIDFSEIFAREDEQF